MKGRIDSDGNLHRDGKKQYCPFAPLRGGAFTQCGDWCPLFGDVKQEELWDDTNHEPYFTDKAFIEICNKKFLELEPFTDERGTDEPV